MSHVIVVGAGLIGGSIALAAKAAGHQVQIKDADQELTEYSSGVLGLPPFEGRTDFEIVVIATPANSVAAIINDFHRLNPDSIFIDVASVKTEVVRDVETVCGELDRFIPTHPMAGKEKGGPENSSFDLFQNRVWTITRLPYSNPNALEAVGDFVQSLGAIPTFLTAPEHDELVARTSHTPQLLATSLAILTMNIEESDLLVSGSGLQDMTRLAASDSDLWADIVLANSEYVHNSLNDFQNLLQELSESINKQDRLKIKSFIDKGNAAKARIPGKHGQAQQKFEVVSIEITDRPGALGELFALAGDAEINIEDVRIDHALGRNIAVIELMVLPEVANTLKNHLRSAGWKIRFDK